MEKKDFFVISIIDNYVKDISGNWVNVFFIGLLFIVFGLVFFIWPDKTLIFVAYLLGAMTVFIGMGILRMALKVKRIERNYQNIKKKIENKFFD
jgi:uncharacterized membrane protein HdeD (DUF308 family)